MPTVSVPSMPSVPLVPLVPPVVELYRRYCPMSDASVEVGVDLLVFAGWSADFSFLGGRTDEIGCCMFTKPTFARSTNCSSMCRILPKDRKQTNGNVYGY